MIVVALETTEKKVVVFSNMLFILGQKVGHANFAGEKVRASVLKVSYGPEIGGHVELDIVLVRCCCACETEQAVNVDHLIMRRDWTSWRVVRDKIFLKINRSRTSLFRGCFKHSARQKWHSTISSSPLRISIESQ